jgi:transcriptional regulator with XRE-family HTH domain
MSTVKITTAADLGLVLRAVRRAHKLRLDDLAGVTGVGHVFVREVEHGKEAVQLGKVLKLLWELGIHVQLSLPDNCLAELERLKATGLRPLKPRRRKPAAGA